MFNTTILFINLPVAPEGRITKISILIIIDLLAIFGNSLFLFAVCSKRSLRHQSRTYLYFSYVSLTSLITALFIIPFPIITLVTKKWSLGSELCYLNAFITTFCLTSCVYSITVLSLHKYVTIVLPMKRRFSQKETLFHCFASFLLSLIIAIVPFIESHVYFNPSTGLCGLYFIKKKTFYTSFIVCACYAVPTLVNISIYIQIFRALRKHGRRLQFNSFYCRASVTAQKQTAKTMYMTFGSFLIGWTPFFVYAILYLAQIVKPTNYLLVVAYMCGFASSAANPLIFIFRNMRLRNSWSSIFRQKQVPRVKLISTVSKYGLPSEASSPPCYMTNADISDNVFFENNNANDDDKTHENKSKEMLENESNFLRTSTNAFDYRSSETKKTFQTNETKF